MFSNKTSGTATALVIGALSLIGCEKQPDSPSNSTGVDQTKSTLGTFAPLDDSALATMGIEIAHLAEAQWGRLDPRNPANRDTFGLPPSIATAEEVQQNLSALSALHERIVTGDRAALIELAEITRTAGVIEHTIISTNLGRLESLIRSEKGGSAPSERLAHYEHNRESLEKRLDAILESQRFLRAFFDRNGLSPVPQELELISPQQQGAARSLIKLGLEADKTLTDEKMLIGFGENLSDFQLRRAKAISSPGSAQAREHLEGDRPVTSSEVMDAITLISFAHIQAATVYENISLEQKLFITSSERSSKQRFTDIYLDDLDARVQKSEADIEAASQRYQSAREHMRELGILK